MVHVGPLEQELGGKGVNQAVAASCAGAAVHFIGAHGAWVANSLESTCVPAPWVNSIDTVGAGDYFAGWLAASLAEGLVIMEAAEIAVTAAALQVSRTGAMEAMPTQEEVDAFLKDHS